MPTIFPDYHSEENWNAFVALFPESERVKAPTYTEAYKGLEEMEKAFASKGMRSVRVKVDAAEWERWVKANNQPLARASVVPYAMHKFSEQISGEDVAFIDSTKA